MKRSKLDFRQAAVLLFAITALYGFSETKANAIISDNSALSGEIASVNGGNIDDLIVVSSESEGMDIKTYLKKNILYPDDAVENNVQGYVKVLFRVEKDGSLKNITTLESTSSELADAVLKILRNTRVKPVMQNGFPQSFTTVLPITFELEKL